MIVLRHIKHNSKGQHSQCFYGNGVCAAQLRETCTLWRATGAAWILGVLVHANMVNMDVCGVAVSYDDGGTCQQREEQEHRDEVGIIIV